MVKFYKCKIKSCIYKVRTKELLDHHMKAYHGRNNYKWCFFCRYTTKVQADLDRHDCRFEGTYERNHPRYCDPEKNESDGAFEDDTDIDSSSDSITGISLGILQSD